MHPPTLHLRHTHIPPTHNYSFLLGLNKQTFLTWLHWAPSSGAVAYLSLKNSSKDRTCPVVVSMEVPLPPHWLHGSTSLYRSRRRDGVWSCLREGTQDRDHPAQSLGDGRWLFWLIETRLVDHSALHKEWGLPDANEKVHIHKLFEIPLPQYTHAATLVLTNEKKRNPRFLKSTFIWLSNKMHVKPYVAGGIGAIILTRTPRVKLRSNTYIGHEDREQNKKSV